jgi:penicillin G amidase
MKIFKWVLAVLLIVILICFLFGYFLLKNSLAPYQGEVSLNSLDHSVEITFDKKGIPQIWAETEKDAYFALGWLHASERLFQMDVTRRISQGRLSEVLGDITLQLDIDSRIIGHRRMALQQQDSLSAGNREILEQYVSGINSFVRETQSMPFEFYLLAYDFEPWTIADCLTILSFQTWYSDDLQNPDKVLTEITSKYGIDKTRSLLFDYPSFGPLTIPAEQKLSFLSDYKNQLARALLTPAGIPFLMNKASNSWVVSPKKSASGFAMMASDPHLETTRIPQFWYYLGLHIKEKNINALGITAAGLPFIVMGHNGQAAWAFTASAVDITEYYQEKINESDSTQYLTPEGWKTFEIIHDSINIAGSDPFNLTILKTRHGPVFYRNDSLQKMYSLDWAGFDNNLDKAVTAGLGLVEVNDYNTFRRTVTQFGALSANWMYADKNGNIGYQLGTPVPMRPADWENLPVKGWENNRIWQCYLSLDETPFVSNPQKGWLASANNKPGNDKNNFHISGNFVADRIERLSQLLSSKDAFTVQDFMSMQMDRYDISLFHWVEKLKKPLMNFGPEGISMSRLLAAWDGYCGIESGETAFIYLFIFTLKKNMLADELGEAYKKTKDSWLLEALDNDSLSWYDDISTTDIKENRKDIINRTIRETFEITHGKTWGDFQSFKMEHPFAVVPILGDLLNLSYGPWPWGGTLGTPLQSYSNYKDHHFDVIIGASWRFIIDFANPDEIKMVLPAGNSGNPMSPHFNDFLDMWLEGRYWTVPLNKDKVYSTAESILRIKGQEE